LTVSDVHVAGVGEPAVGEVAGADGAVPVAGEVLSRRGPLAVASGLLALTKPRIVELLLITTVPTMLLARRGLPGVGLVVATVAGGALAAGGANALNMVYDRDIDARMSRTARRPLVTGLVSPLAAATFALLLEVGAFVLLWGVANLLAAVITLGAAAFYVGVYTALLKRHTRHNIVIGGAAGAAPVLVAWAAVTGGVSPVAWGLFAVIFLWTPPHFWALAVRFRDDYAEAGVPMLPAVVDARKVCNQILGYSVALALTSVAITPLGGLGPLYLAGSSALGAGFVAKAWQLRIAPTPKRALKLFHWSITYLTLLFVLVAVVAVLPR
jgi:protoheme IX farnesyltransferase